MAGRFVGFEVQEVRLIPAMAIRYEGGTHSATLDEPARPQLKYILHAGIAPGSLVQQIHACRGKSGLKTHLIVSTHEHIQPLSAFMPWRAAVFSRVLMERTPAWKQNVCEDAHQSHCLDSCMLCLGAGCSPSCW